MQITRRLEFDAGHRIPDHKSQCRHLHGHRYAIEVTLSGHIINQSGNASNGMVMDFSDVKTIVNERVVNAWDHAFLVHEGDGTVIEMLKSIPDHKTVVLPRVPTAENLARIAFDLLDPAFQNIFGSHLRLERVRLYETPNCWADALRHQDGAIDPD